jgi:universal stress protein A
MSPDDYAHVACCVDRSEMSEPVQGRAAKIADLTGARLTLLHVITPSMVTIGDAGAERSAVERRKDAQRWLDGLVARYPTSTGVIIESGNIGEALDGWVAANDASLLIVGQREGDVLTALGSTASYVVRHAPCDVLVVNRGGRD